MVQNLAAPASVQLATVPVFHGLPVITLLTQTLTLVTQTLTLLTETPSS